MTYRETRQQGTIRKQARRAINEEKRKQAIQLFTEHQGNISQKELANLVNTSQREISRYLTDHFKAC